MTLVPTLVHTLTRDVQDHEIDELGHVSNLVYLHWVLDAALAHSTARGYDTAAYRELGVVFVVRRHEIDYLRPALAGQTIEIRTWVDSWKQASSVRRTDIVRADDASHLARAATTWAYVAMPGGRPTRIPEILRERFGSADGQVP